MGFLKFEITTRKNVPLDSAYKINPNATDYTALRQFMQGVFSVLNQSLGGGDGFGRDFSATDDTCNFIDAHVVGDFRNTGGGDVGVGTLLYLKVFVGKSRNLGRMGDNQCLAATGQTGQTLADGTGGGATDTGVHFVKDKCVIACPVGQNNPQCQH